jgi:hypothetical protein
MGTEIAADSNSPPLSPTPAPNLDFDNDGDADSKKNGNS